MRVSFHTPSMALPPDPPSNLEEPIESISSMKMIDGACSLKKKQTKPGLHVVHVED